MFINVKFCRTWDQTNARPRSKKSFFTENIKETFSLESEPIHIAPSNFLQCITNQFVTHQGIQYELQFEVWNHLFLQSRWTREHQSTNFFKVNISKKYFKIGIRLSDWNFKNDWIGFISETSQQPFLLAKYKNVKNFISVKYLNFVWNIGKFGLVISRRWIYNYANALQIDEYFDFAWCWRRSCNHLDHNHGQITEFNRLMIIPDIDLI